MKVRKLVCSRETEKYIVHARKDYIKSSLFSQTKKINHVNNLNN